MIETPLNCAVFKVISCIVLSCCWVLSLTVFVYWGRKYSTKNQWVFSKIQQGFRIVSEVVFLQFL